MTPTETARRLEYLDIDQLLPALSNPKSHDLAELSASLERFGFTAPAELDERTGRLVAGHGRLERLRVDREAGKPAPEGVTVDPEGRWLMPVVRGWSSASDAEARAYVITANKLVEAGGWHQERLYDDLASIKLDTGDLSGTTFTDADLEALRVQVKGHDRKRPQADPDDSPVPRAELVSKPGDVWLLGPHRVCCGDATREADVVRLYGDGIPEMVLTDPPYCSGGFQEAGRAAGSIGTSAKQTSKLANDTLSTRGYVALMKGALSLARGASLAYIFTDWRMWVNLYDVAESSGFGVRAMVVWDKGTPGMGRGWRSQHELVLCGMKGAVSFDPHKAQGNVIRSKRTGNPLHPTQKPVDLLETILAVNDHARTVYDPFGGSGSVLLAAHNTGRRALVMELDPAYVDVICRRWAGYTGEAATLEATGEPFEAVPAPVVA